jgi:hypothetical protein
MDENLNDSESSVSRIQQLEHGMHALLFLHSCLGIKMCYQQTLTWLTIQF